MQENDLVGESGPTKAARGFSGFCKKNYVCIGGIQRGRRGRPEKGGLKFKWRRASL